MQNVMNTLSSLTDFPEIENDIIHGDMPGDKIEINMSDKQKIWINARDKHFYKLVTYLEQKKLFEK